MVKSIIKPSSPTLRPDHPKEYQVLARTNNLFYAQYVKEHVVLRQKKLIKPQRLISKLFYRKDCKFTTKKNTIPNLFSVFF